MDLSIIIPCHNLEKFITPLLVSLRLQELSSFQVELIFVCDNCQDKTKSLIEHFNFNEMYTVHVLECNVQSCGLARNEGLKIATGNYVWFIDGDDWLINNKAIFTVLKTIRRKNRQIVRFGYEHPSYFKYPGYFSMVWQYVYSKELIEGMQFKKIQPSEDVVWQLEIIEKIGGEGKIHSIGMPLYYYNYMREGSNMQQYSTKKKIEQ